MGGQSSTSATPVLHKATVFRLVTTSHSANTAPPVTLPEQFSVLLKTTVFRLVTTSRSANTAPPATLPGQVSVLPKTTVFRSVTTSRSANTIPPATLPGQFTVLPRMITQGLHCSAIHAGARSHLRCCSGVRSQEEQFIVLLRTGWRCQQVRGGGE